MKTKKIYIFFLLFVFCYYKAQKSNNNDNKISVNSRSSYFDSDSIIIKEADFVSRSTDSINVDLKLINVYGLPKFNNDLDRRQYNWLKTKVYRLYPYLLLAVSQYNDVQGSLEANKNNPKFKKYIQERQKQLSAEYETKLKGLTKTEGKIFSKLMYRSTGKTVYEIIRELRGGWSAFWWNVKANAFDIDLKEPYDPYHIRDDAYVEAILMRAYQFGDLRPIPKYNHD